MEFQFQRDLDFQSDAINSVVDLFRSRKFMHENFLLIPENGIIPNRLDLSQEQLLENLHEIQKKIRLNLMKNSKG